MLVREFPTIFIQIREKSGKNFLVHISFSLTHCEAVRKVVVSFAVNKCKLYHFA